MDCARSKSRSLILEIFFKWFVCQPKFLLCILWFLDFFFGKSAAAWIFCFIAAKNLRFQRLTIDGAKCELGGIFKKVVPDRTVGFFRKKIFNDNKSQKRTIHTWNFGKIIWGLILVLDLNWILNGGMFCFEEDGFAASVILILCLVLDAAAGHNSRFSHHGQGVF